MDGFALPVRRWPERRPVVLGAAALLFVGLFVLRMSTNDVNTGIGLLFVIPTGLVALELGMVAGLGVAGLATALVVIWSRTRGAELGVQRKDHARVSRTRSGRFYTSGIRCM